MNEISMLGISSQGATAELIKKIEEIETHKINNIKLKEDKISYKISSWGKINFLLQNLSDKLNNLGEKSFSFLKSSDNECFKAVSNDFYGSHKIKVIQLAKKHVLSLSVPKSMNEILGNKEPIRYINIIHGKEIKPGLKNNTVIKIKRSESSLRGIEKAINQSGAKIKAEIKKIGLKNKNRLILTSNILGEEGKINIHVEGDEKLNRMLCFPYNENVNEKSKLEYKKENKNFNEPKLEEIQRSDNSIIKVDNNLYYRKTNIIRDVLKNVTLNLKKTSKESSKNLEDGETLSFYFNKEKFLKFFKDFVKSFNLFINESNKLREFEINEKSISPYQKRNDKLLYNIGPFIGDYLLNNITNKLKFLIRKNFDDYKNKNIIFIEDVGIKINPKNGNLILDNDKLIKNMQNNWKNLRNFFLKSNFISDISSFIEDNIYKKGTINSNKSIISEINNLNKQKKIINKEIEKSEMLSYNKINMYKEQFKKLDLFMSKTDYIRKQLSALFSNNKN